jgi:hypothetical protein
MLCDVTHAVAEFMVRVLRLPRSIVIHDVAGVEARPCIRSNNMHLGCVHILTCVAINRVETLKGLRLG